MQKYLQEETMQAIEFDAHIENGLIHLPKKLQSWQAGKHVKVILLADDGADEKQIHPDIKSINSHAGKLKLSKEPLSFQDAIRNEWS
ncbi:hypothetical protein [Methylomonas methanica]|uniref:hypothetical protein n=1 Tax=Methylomonas methanica TaxID=421 RepID=UPI0018D49C3F|nr:hypothetical protein [Methylomonas methanica]